MKIEVSQSYHRGLVRIYQLEHTIPKRQISHGSLGFKGVGRRRFEELGS